MKILVTGCAGFVGFNTIRKLLTGGHQILGIDNLNDYYSPQLKSHRLNVIKHQGFEFLKGDITDSDFLDKIFSNTKFDLVINLAAQVGVRNSISHPNEYINTNIVGFHNVIKKCHDFGIKKFIYASSSSVYGQVDSNSFNEDQRIDKPVSLYAATKACDEMIANAYFNLGMLSIVGLRFFTVYGPWGRPDMSYYLFADSIVQGKELKIFNNGQMIRDFTYIDDIVNGISAIVENFPEKQNRTYNIGGGSPIELNYFIELLEKNLGKKAIKKFLPHQMGDVTRTYADITKIENDFGFKPRTSIEDGIKHFVDWYKDYHFLSNLS